MTGEHVGDICDFAILLLNYSRRSKQQLSIRGETQSTTEGLECVIIE